MSIFFILVAIGLAVFFWRAVLGIALFLAAFAALGTLVVAVLGGGLVGILSVLS